MNQHRSRIVPPSFINTISAESRDKRDEKVNELSRELQKAIGEPYFHQDGFFLYNAPCEQLLPKLHDADIQIPLCVTSPPYNIGKEYEENLSVEEYVEWSRRWISEVYNITTSDGSFWLNLGFFEVPKKGLCVPIAYLLWDKSDFKLLQEVVWHYGAGVQSKTRFCPRNEKWLFFVKQMARYTFNLDDVRDTNVKYPNQKKGGKIRCNPLGKNPSDVWEIPKVTSGANRASKERVNHPAQFPLRLVERIVRCSSNELDVVLDPFSGSASTGIAAHAHNRIYIGIELSEDYCDLAVERFKKYMEFKEEESSQLWMI